MDALGGNLILLVLLLFVFYAMLWRPNKRRINAHRELIASIEVGDRVLMSGGLYGTISALGDEDIEVEIAPGTRVRYVKNSVLQRITEHLDSEDDGTDEDESLSRPENT